jgi:hypothetical protein
MALNSSYAQCTTKKTEVLCSNNSVHTIMDGPLLNPSRRLSASLQMDFPSISLAEYRRGR